jgi:hypothetical protein
MKSKFHFRMQSTFHRYSESLRCKPPCRHLTPLINNDYVPVNPWNAALPADAPAPNIAAPPSRFGIDFKNWPCCEYALAIRLLAATQNKVQLDAPPDGPCERDGSGCHGSYGHLRGSSYLHRSDQTDFAVLVRLVSVMSLALVLWLRGIFSSIGTYWRHSRGPFF